MIVRELITKLSYMVDDSGLKKFNTSIASAISSVNNQLSGIQEKLTQHTANNNKVAESANKSALMRQKKRELNAVKISEYFERAKQSNLTKIRLDAELKEGKANNSRLVAEKTLADKIGRMRMESA